MLESPLSAVRRAEGMGAFRLPKSIPTMDPALAAGLERVSFAGEVSSARNPHVLRHRRHRTTPTSLPGHHQRRIASKHHPRLPQPRQIPPARIRDHARPLPRAHHTRSGCFPGKGHAVHQRRVLLPFEEQAGCLDTQLQPNPNPQRRKIHKLCPIHPRESRSEATSLQPRGLRIHLRKPSRPEPHARPPTELISP